jgi:glycosyltransferase involved in cell wall biosynthesis
MPKVSVVMSVYNGERHLKEAVDSILCQTFKEFEFIIIDDGSTDGTPKILEEYLGKDQRIEVLHQENAGLTRSLNRGIALVQGGYIARMDADDVAFPERLEKQVDFMHKNPEVGLLGTTYYEIDGNSNRIGKKVFPTSDDELQKTLIKYNPFSHASVIIRKETLDKVGLYDENIKRAQDYDLWFKIGRVSKIANLKEPLMMRRYSNKNISIANENEQLKWAIRIRKKAIREGQYPLWNFIYLFKPYIALILPYVIRKFLRKYLLKSRIYG